LYFPGYGRLTIRPEQSRNTELGLYLDQRDSKLKTGWHGKAVMFNNAVRDLIVYAPVCPDPDPQFAFGCADNVNRARLRGVSLELGRQLGALNWRVSADFMDPVDRTLGNLLPRRSKRQLRLALDYRVGQWLLGTDVRAESARFDDAANSVRLGGYGLINLSVRRELATGWTGFLSVSNATDKDYTTAAGFRPQGRFAMLGIRFKSAGTR
jgi:vitamin B12 transporter